MSRDSPDDDRIDALRDRIAELESKVPDGPSRRQVLAGGGLLAAGGLLGGGASQQVSAQSAAGQVGTSSEPVDVEAANVNAGSVSTDGLDIAGGFNPIRDIPLRLLSTKQDDGNVTPLATKLTVDGSVQSGYQGGHTVFASNGEMLALWGADAVHNHFKVYTKPNNVGSGDKNNEKRLNIEGGNALTDTIWQNIDAFRIRSNKTQFDGRTNQATASGATFNGSNNLELLMDNGENTDIEVVQNDGSGGKERVWQHFIDSSPVRYIIWDRLNDNQVWQMHGDGGVQTEAVDLSAVSGEDGRIYQHDGSSTISADGGTTSSKGYFVWSSNDTEWKSMAQF